MSKSLVLSIFLSTLVINFSVFSLTPALEFLHVITSAEVA